MVNNLDPSLIYKWKMGVKDPRKYIVINKVSSRKVYYTQYVELDDDLLKEKFSKYLNEFLERFEVDWARSTKKIFRP
jgi:hypothetical protein